MRGEPVLSNKELQEYLNRFPDDAQVIIILANPRKRKLYELKDVMFVTDQGQPLILIDVEKEADMDEEMVEACKEDENLEGQMEIEDYPEYLPDDFKEK